MGWKPLVDVRDRAAFTLLMVGGPLDLAYERCIVTATYEHQGIPINWYYYGKLCFRVHIDCCKCLIKAAKVLVEVGFVK